MASIIKVDKLTGKSGTDASAPITLSGDTATLGTGVTIPAAGITGTLGSGVTLDSGITGIPAAGVTGTLGSGVVFPAGHVLNTVVETGTAGSSETSTTTTEVLSTISDITIPNVLASSKCVMWFWSGSVHAPSQTVLVGYVKNETTGNTLQGSPYMQIQATSAFDFYTCTLLAVDTAPATGSNQYRVHFWRSGGSGTAHWIHTGAPHFSNTIMEIAQ